MATSWPPETLTVNTQELINECELMEVHPERGAGKVFVPIVELAALLYTGEYVHARHVWRRWKPNGNSTEPLEEWWKVGRAMMESDPATLWQGLAHIQQHHPAPLNAYAKEVGDAYRERIIRRFASATASSCKQQQVPFPPTQPYWSLLNFATHAEYEQFCHQQQKNKVCQQNVGAVSHNPTTSLTQVVAFLESTPWNV